MNKKVKGEWKDMSTDHKYKKNGYEDIIHLPHHVSKTRPQMSISDRAAQFSPFAALTGYEEAIEETKRLHEEHYERRSHL